MSAAYFSIAAASLALIGALPRIFFRRDGRLNLRWLLTAAPFFAAAAFVLATAAGLAGPMYPPLDGARAMHEALGALLGCASMLLVGITLGSHRVPLALWHQDDDAPRHIVTWGAYAHIRHPFYSAFLLALAGVLVAAPHVVSLVCLAAGAVLLNTAAAREEHRLAASQFGTEYRDYRSRTGRFWPRRWGG